MKIFSRILFVLPLMALLFSSCLKEISYETIDMEYVTPSNGLIPAEAGEITIRVISTHSFRMSSTSSAFSFFKDGLVNYSKDGVRPVGTEHTVNVSANNDSLSRVLFIQATHLGNSEITSSLPFLQLGKGSDQQETDSVQ
ncbi:MAG: hypothetical protein IKW22_03130 [Bacteroidaceae bacterium]|nr:hypothetical protein [Bacteroidaceae bacterium]